MGKVLIEQIIYGAWGNCLRVSNEIIDLVATLDFGPRIIRFGAIEKENMFFEDVEFKAVNFNEQFKVFGGGEWRLYGGHRIWASPEASPRTYYPDNEPVEFEKIKNGIVLKAKEEKWTNLQKELVIVMEEDAPKATISNRITNRGAWPIKFSPWSLTVMASGGTEIIPQPNRQTGLLGNRLLVLWPYSKMNDKRVYWGEKYIAINQDPNSKSEFKLGINNEHGWAAYFNNNCLFIKRYNHKMEVEYPDYGVSYETFTRDLFLEMEVLGELRSVNPNETAEVAEQWELYTGILNPKNEEEKIAKFLEKFI